MTIPTDGFLGVPGCCSRGAGVVAGCPPSPAPVPDLPGYMGRSSGQAGRMNGGGGCCRGQDGLPPGDP